MSGAPKRQKEPRLLIMSPSERAAVFITASQPAERRRQHNQYHRYALALENKSAVQPWIRVKLPFTPLVRRGVDMELEDEVLDLRGGGPGFRRSSGDVVYALMAGARPGADPAAGRGGAGRAALLRRPRKERWERYDGGVSLTAALGGDRPALPSSALDDFTSQRHSTLTL
ncbi:unnamed protein product [Lota lota]